MVYAADVGKRRLHFQVSGWLWRRSLVMFDAETKSWWSHILGECMKGKLKGSKLEPIPAEMTTWRDWKARHPKTTVLDMTRTSIAYTQAFYRDPGRFVYGVVLGGEEKAYPFDLLARHRVIQDEMGKVPVLVTYDPDSTRATVFRREIGGKKGAFVYDAKKDVLTDRTTGSRWDAARGLAISGKLKGTQLEVLPGIVSYRHTWKLFHPKSAFSGEGSR